MPDVTSVAVEGGRLEVHRLGAGPTAIVALHGITSNGLSFGPLAERLRGDAAVLAPDLRGRAGSAATVAPAGLSAHADDVIALLDAEGLDDVVLLGHSMGAYVAALAAVRYPDRFRRLILVDGGVAFPPPPGADIDELLIATIGPAMQRLSMTFADPAAYLDFWRPHPAVGPAMSGPDGAAVHTHLLHDLVAAEPAGYRSSCVIDVIRADGAGVLSDPEVHAAAKASPVPATLLRAERGMLDQTPGLLPDVAIEAAGLPDSIEIRLVPGVNHYSIILADPGASTVAAAVREHLG